MPGPWPWERGRRRERQLSMTTGHISHPTFHSLLLSTRLLPPELEPDAILLAHGEVGLELEQLEKYCFLRWAGKIQRLLEKPSTLRQISFQSRVPLGGKDVNYFYNRTLGT